MFAELLGDRLDESDIRIFATDLDADSIAFARRGIYPQTAFTEMAPELIQKYFTPVDDAYQIKKRIRALTVFGEYDLGQRAPFPRIDLVLCRNVLIYFTKDLQQRTLQLFAFSLREAGYLVLGKSETTSPLPQYFSNVHPLLKIFRRQGERLMVPVPAFTGESITAERPARRNFVRAPGTPRRSADPSARWSLTERVGAFLFESSIGIVAVDRNYDIQTINQAGRQLLSIHGQGVGEDLIHLMTGTPAAALKTAIDEAFRNVRPAPLELELDDAATRESKFVQATCYPQNGIPADGNTQGAVIMLQDVTALSRERRRFKDECERAQAELQQVMSQNAQLLAQHRTLSEANNELAATNAELRSANEHLLIAAEEAEASAEEVETLNEEMQATSEELETLNEELQATVEELNTTNEELGARGDDLERVLRERQEEIESAHARAALFEAALRKSPLVAAVLDRAGTIALTTSAYDRIAETGGLPRSGETWKDEAARIDVQTAKNTLTFEVSTIPVETGAGPGKLVTLMQR